MANALWRRLPGNYRGLTMRCAPGTHEAAMDLIRATGTTRGAVLDLASGSGAMIARLQDAGFTDLTAIELDAKKFAVPGIAPLAVDLNADFATKIGRKFKLVTAIEIIEHLNSPRHFLQQTRELLDDDGLLLLTTPNVADWMGRVRFFLTGTLRYFDDSQYRYNHHVSPLPEAQLRHLLTEVGLKIVAQKTAGTFFGPLKMACMAPIWLPFFLFAGNRAMGDVNLYALRRADPLTSRPEDWTTE
jgi:2-polyprenyl-3-methyl-5-hydroxy-6-metoxy-1,4-benzoquinol methylase